MNQLFVDADELQGVAADAKRAANQIEIVAAVLHVDQASQEDVAVHPVAQLESQRHLDIVGRRTEAVDARDRRDDQRVAPRQDRLRRGVAETLDLVVDRGVFLDVGIGVRDVRLGLVVIEIRDEVLDRVLGKEIAKFGTELRRERLVVAQDEGRFLHHLDDTRHRNRLPAAGHAEQRLRPVAAQHAFGQQVGRFRLVTRQRIWQYELEFLHQSHHTDPIYPPPSFTSRPSSEQIQEAAGRRDVADAGACAERARRASDEAVHEAARVPRMERVRRPGGGNVALAGRRTRTSMGQGPRKGNFPTANTPSSRDRGLPPGVCP